MAQRHAAPHPRRSHLPTLQVHQHLALVQPQRPHLLLAPAQIVEHRRGQRAHRHGLRVLQPLRLERSPLGQHHPLRILQARAPALRRSRAGLPPRLQARRELLLRPGLHRRGARLHHPLRPHQPRRHRLHRELFALRHRGLRLPQRHPTGNAQLLGFQQPGNENQVGRRHLGLPQNLAHRRTFGLPLLQPRRQSPPLVRPQHQPPPATHQELHLLARRTVGHLRL